MMGNCTANGNSASDSSTKAPHEISSPSTSATAVRPTTNPGNGAPPSQNNNSTTPDSTNMHHVKPPRPPSDDDNIDGAAQSSDMETIKQLAIGKIQRQARRKMAIKVAQAQQQWKMFADLDTQDEAEMLHLAVFMQTLIDAVPTIEHHDSNELKSHLDDGASDEDDVGMLIRLKSIQFFEKSSANMSDQSDPAAEYEITQSKINSQVAAEIIEVYRKGGKLSRKSVVKILRKAYKALQKQKNVTHISVPAGCKLTVVGDLHGQLSDLLHILDESGLPGPDNKFVFNGDFVDRGEYGLEVICILFALYVAEGGNCVALDRGNHEDLPVCRVYGFENEVKEKYDELLFEMFAEVFNYLPLFTLVNESIFIVHGGLFHTPDVLIEELDEIDRADYYVKPPVPYPLNTAGLSEEDARKEYLKQLQRDALWSDPTTEEGVYLNPRGAGVSFGPDIARDFMELNNISMVIRSHECVYKGYELAYCDSYGSGNPSPHSAGGGFFRTNSFNGGLGGSTKEPMRPPPGCPLLCTIFSASNYSDGDNEGAYLLFLPHKFHGSVPAGTLPRGNKGVGGSVVGASGGSSSNNVNASGNGSGGGSDNGGPVNNTLHYTVHSYKTSQGAGDLAQSNKVSLADHIMKKKTALTTAFEAADTENLGVISRLEWAEIMQRVTLIKIRWLAIIDQIAPAECLSSNSVAYRIFLKAFTVEYRRKIEGAAGGSGSGGYTQNNGNQFESALMNGGATAGTIDDMYGQRKKLETVFYFFDSDGDGVISLEEFREGCAMINATLDSDSQLTDIDHTLEMMDFDNSGSIDINEFFETFRILDAKDGKVDGVISLAKSAKPPQYNSKKLPPGTPNLVRDALDESSHHNNPGGVASGVSGGGGGGRQVSHAVQASAAAAAGLPASSAHGGTGRKQH